jgi:ssDNA thymidine ADP-ribosyltransferase, DarT
MLHSNGVLQKKKIVHANIAYQGAQGKRATKLVARPPGGVIHDYVPFYFAPRSPMLMAVNEGRVEGCPHRQEDIVHLVTTVEAIVAAHLPYVFYDYNATLGIATCFSHLRDLDKIDWELFHEAPRMNGYCRYWHSRLDNLRYIRRMETRQAEFLVHKTVPLNLIETIDVYSASKAAGVRAILDEAGVELQVEVKPAWYY